MYKQIQRFRRRKPTPLLITLVGALLIILSCSALTETEQVVFVFTGPPKDVPPLGPHTVIFYTYDPAGDTLSTFWSLPPHEYVSSMKLYSRNRLFLIGTGSGYDMKHLFSIPLQKPSAYTRIDLSRFGRVHSFGLREQTDGQLDLQVLVNEHGAVKQLFVDLATGDERKPSESTPGERRVTGTGTPFYGPAGDAVSFRLLDSGHFRSFIEEVNLDGAPIPDSIVRRKESNGWNLVANEPRFRALLSVADRPGYANSELLIYDRTKDTWRSLMIPGSATSLRLVNNWLVGTIAYRDPNTDYVRHFGGPPVMTDSAVLISVPENKTWTVELGNQCEVLLIKDSDVYYRTGRKLYHASLTEEGLMDRRLLVDDPRVYSMHWAFSSSAR